MAQYDYRCSECQIIHSVNHSVNESPEILCGLCKIPMRKVYHAPATVFPGDGWGKDAR